MIGVLIPLYLVPTKTSDMKNSLLIFYTVLGAFGLLAFGYVNWNAPKTDQEKTAKCQVVAFDGELQKLLNLYTPIDLLYNVDSRFVTTITKEDLLNARTVADLLPQEATQFAESYETTEVCILRDDEKLREFGEDAILNSAQLSLLRSADYSTNFYISASFESRDAESGKQKKESTIYYMTVIPENEATFVEGPEVLIDYLKKGSKEATAIITKDGLQPGMVGFTVNAKGKVTNVNLSSTSGYPTVDEALVELMEKIPGKWHPATNARGENIDQELVFFFGLRGC